MRSIAQRLRWLSPLVLLVCSSCGINTGIYSCIAASSHYCVDYGMIDQFPAATKCGLTSGGSLQSNACPAASRVGSCAEADTTVRYYSPGFDATSAQSACTTDGGTFTAGR